MEEEVEVRAACEFGKLEIARKPKTRKRRKKLKTGVKRNCQLAYGFDFGSDGLVRAPQHYDYDCSLYARLGLYCYNFEKGTNLKFVRWEKYNFIFTSYYDVYLTLHAMDPACNSVSPFQILFSDAGCIAKDTYVIRMWRILACRPTCNKLVNEYWDRDEDAIDQFYTGEMPKWLSDEALATDNKKYYVVQEADLHENDWPHLFTEIAFFSIVRAGLEASPPLEINKLVVETKEDYITEAREKLLAKNAIFYISYKYRGDPSIGSTGDHRAIIRKTMDGEPEHMCLEIASERQAK